MVEGYASYRHTALLSCYLTEPAIDAEATFNIIEPSDSDLGTSVKIRNESESGLRALPRIGYDPTLTC